MQLDSALEFSDLQSLVASSAAVTQSTNVVDTTEAKTFKDAWGSTIDNEIGDMFLNMRIGTAVNASTIITVNVMTHSAATSIASGTSIVSYAFPAAAGADSSKSIGFPIAQPVAERYLGLTYTVSGAKCTAGTIDAWLGTQQEARGQ